MCCDKYLYIKRTMSQDLEHLLNALLVGLAHAVYNNNDDMELVIFNI